MAYGLGLAPTPSSPKYVSTCLPPPYFKSVPTDSPQFESTLILPAGSPDKTPANDVQAFWPGMEPASSGAVFQNVITNQGGGPSEWYLLPFYCCKYVFLSLFSFSPPPKGILFPILE
jgi:hypothetical protein